MKKLTTPLQLAQKLGVNPSRIYYLIERKKIEAIKLGGIYVIDNKNAQKAERLIMKKVKSKNKKQEPSFIEKLKKLVKENRDSKENYIIVTEQYAAINGSLSDIVAMITLVSKSVFDEVDNEIAIVGFIMTLADTLLDDEDNKTTDIN